ncbi:MAG TPA: NAD-dependent epimerase/dehydratase family protein [Nevskiaceae bacterium]|nr:NAD-dependent epimerase/dehydratase family protein [Nevskiaceae bacterium]
MRVLVTGGAGFIGSHIVEHHLSRGDQVLALDNLSTGSEANIAPFLRDDNFRFQRGDLLSWTDLRSAVAWSERIYHMAAVVGMFHVLERPAETLRTNIDGCERVLYEARRTGGTAELVVASSSSVYGKQSTDRMREECDITISPGEALANYALSKLTNELQSAAYAQKNGIKVVCVRLFNTIGPRQSGMYGFVVPRFVQQALAHEPITVFGDGTQTRSFCDVRDIVAMLDQLACTPAAYGKVVNVGQSREVTIQALAELVRSRCNSRSELKYIPYAQAYNKDFAQIPQRRPVLDRLHGLIHFRHAWSLERTIDDLVERRRVASVQRRVSEPATLRA